MKPKNPEWLKRTNSHVYRRRAKKMAERVKNYLGAKKLNKSYKNMIHFFMEPMTFEEKNRYSS